jgi:hypothetical protein
MWGLPFLLPLLLRKMKIDWTKDPFSAISLLGNVARLETPYAERY